MVLEISFVSKYMFTLIKEILVIKPIMPKLSMLWNRDPVLSTK